LICFRRFEREIPGLRVKPAMTNARVERAMTLPVIPDLIRDP
jgi:hypothetical protein